MGDKSNIEWTDATWNPVRGCTKVSPGCANCYAETFAERWRGVPNHPYTQGFDLRLVPEKLDDPLRWKTPRRIFVNSMSDLFQDGVDDAFVCAVFDTMRRAPQHTFQLLTKRPARMRTFVERIYPRHMVGLDANWPRFHQWPLPNVWLGVSVENQHFADERIPLLLQTPAAVRFISAEPLLGRIEFGYGVLSGCDACCTGDRCEGPPDCTRFNRRSCPICKGTANGINLDWVIIGGESGQGARAFNLAWARSIIAQCHSARVPVFMKQLGKVPYEGEDPFTSANSRLYALDLDKGHGGDPVEWPADLRVRQFPEEM